MQEEQNFKVSVYRQRFPVRKMIALPQFTSCANWGNKTMQHNHIGHQATNQPYRLTVHDFLLSPWCLLRGFAAILKIISRPFSCMQLSDKSSHRKPTRFHYISYRNIAFEVKRNIHRQLNRFHGKHERQQKVFTANNKGLVLHKRGIRERRKLASKICL